jgi:hypothetical protein
MIPKSGNRFSEIIRNKNQWRVVIQFSGIAL